MESNECSISSIRSWTLSMPNDSLIRPSESPSRARSSNWNCGVRHSRGMLNDIYLGTETAPEFSVRSSPAWTTSVKGFCAHSFIPARLNYRGLH